MVANLLISVVVLLLASDSRTPSAPIALNFNQGQTWVLEESEGNGGNANLMTCGDYSGCTIVTDYVLPIAGSVKGMLHDDRMLSGIEQAVIRCELITSRTASLP